MTTSEKLTATGYAGLHSHHRDGALEQVLNAYERVLHDFPRENHRHRLVHGQVGNLALYKKIAELGLNINIQPASTSTDIPIMEARLGSRRNTAMHGAH